MADETPHESEDTEPITPEVLDGGDGTPPRRGASSRKRRVAPTPDGTATDDGSATDDEAAPLPGLRPRREATGRLFRTACMLLIGLGILELVTAVPLILDPAEARCDNAQLVIERANDDDEDFNDVDLPEGADDEDDIECDEAIALAGAIPDDEGDEPSGDFAPESAFLIQGIVFAAHGLALGTVGFLLQRRRTRLLRTIALVLVVLAVLPLSQLGLIGMALIVFLIYALAISADAKALFPPDPNRPSLFRPRPPAAS